MKRILIVDDSSASRLIIKSCIPKDMGYTIDEAKGGAEALEKAGENKPDLVLCDYNMPDKNGVEVALDFKGAGIETKFVLVSANLQTSVTESAKAAGFIGTIRKPLSKDALLDCFKSCGI